MSYQRTCFVAAVAVAASAAVTGCKESSPATDQAGSAPRPTPTQTTTPSRVEPPKTATAKPSVAPGDPGKAMMTFDETFHDFGSVSDTADVTHDFSFVNNGGKKLKIDDISTSCGCTKAVASADEFAPGESGTISVTYDPRGEGQHSYRVNLATNAGKQELQIRANVDPFVAVEPRRITMENLALNEKHEADIVLTCKDPKMTVESVTVRNEHVTARAVDGNVHVEISEDAPWGELKETIVIVAKGTPQGASEPIEHTIYVPMTASIFGEVHASPSTYRLGVIKPGETFQKAIELTRATGAPLDVTAVEVQESNVAGVSVRIEPDDREPSKLRLVLEGDSRNHTGPVHGVIVFKTSATGDRKSRLRFSGIVR